MNETFNNLIEFIKNDTIMMVLCGIIAVLIVIFLIVLIFGKKDKPKKEENLVGENTTQLFTSEIDNAILRSTSEYTFKNEALTNESGIPIIGGTPSTAASIFDETIPAPAKEEPLAEIKEDIIPIPVIMPEEETKLEMPILEMPEEPVQIPEPIVEMPKVEPNSYSNQVFSSVTVTGKEMPSVSEEVSKTEIIRHIPTEEPVKAQEMPFDDLDLPKLNTNKENSVISSLTGESFKI